MFFAKFRKIMVLLGKVSKIFSVVKSRLGYRVFEFLFVPIFLWTLCFLGLFALRVFGKWEVSGYFALLFFFVIPSFIERSNQILGIDINIKRDILFFAFSFLFFTFLWAILFFFVGERKIGDIITFSPRFPNKEDLKWFLIYFLGVSVPEEFFFRGFMQGRFNMFFGKRLKFLGVSLGPGFFLQSIFFMIIHLVWSLHIVRFLVFFPGLLFGFLREKYSSIVPPIIFHTFSNVFMILIVK
jgi:membrane protease YdiL (CAAX protease family)